jgi:hypothetical protein
MPTGSTSPNRSYFRRPENTERMQRWPGRQVSPKAERVERVLLICSVAEVLIPNPLHIFEQNLLAAPIVEFCGAAVGVASDSLGHLQRSSVL